MNKRGTGSPLGSEEIETVIGRPLAPLVANRDDDFPRETLTSLLTYEKQRKLGLLYFPERSPRSQQMPHRERWADFSLQNFPASPTKRDWLAVESPRLQGTVSHDHKAS